MIADGYRLGIDFGTSNTVAVLADPAGRIRPLLFDSSPLLSSAVFAGPGGELRTGADADRAAVANAAAYEPNPKRRIDDAMVWLGEGEHPVVELVAAVLRRVAAEAERVAGGPPAGVVLTHPAGWSRPRRTVLADAAARAGLDRLGFVAEPVAAAAYFATVLGRDLPVGRCLVVYDLGAGTFDVAVVARTSGGFEVVAAAGLPDVGGLDLDAAVVGHARTLTADAAEAWGRLDWPQTPADLRARHALWAGARAAKEQLTRHTTADLHIPLIGAGLHLTRDEFDKAARAYLDRTVALTLTTLREAGTPRERIAGVFLVGGSSRIPLAATLLHRALRIAPTAIDHPELVVAEGSLHAGATHLPTVRPPAVAPPPGPRAGDPAPVARAPRTGVARRRKAVLAGASTLPLLIGLCLVIGPEPGRTAAKPPEPGASSPASAVKSETVYSVVFSPDGKTIATASEDGTARLWTVAADRTTSLAATFTVGTIVHSVAFSPDGTSLATGGTDGDVRLWNVGTGQVAGTVVTGRPVDGVVFSPDGRTLAVLADYSDDVVRLHRLPPEQGITLLKGHEFSVEDLAFSPDGRTVATASTDWTVRLWSVATGRATATIQTNSQVYCVAFSPDGKSIATAEGDRTVRVWDVATGRTVAILTGHTGTVSDLAFSPDGKTLATAGGEDHTVRLWDLGTGRSTNTLTGHTGYVWSVAFSPDGTTLASAGANKEVRLWSVAG